MDPLRNLGFLIKDVARLYGLNFERNAGRLNLTLSQCKVLCYLQRNEGISQVRLAYLTDTDPMTLVRILDRMEGDGLIERRPDAADRRARRLHLLPAAFPVLDEIWRVSDCARAESLAGLSAADRTQLMSLMQRVQTNLDKLVPEAPETAGAVAAPAHKRVQQMHGEKS
jgi:DNA-binding MarR family transcriptional regulator